MVRLDAHVSSLFGVKQSEARVLIVGFGPRALPLSLARIERAKHRAPAGVADYPPSSLGAHAAGQAEGRG